MKNYFVAAGIPADQISRVGSTWQIGALGQRGQPEPPPSVLGISSMLTRSIGGYVVVDSIAEASINSNGEVTQEAVYWPAIPTSVVSDAQAIDAVLADPIAGPAYLSALPPHDGESRVVIRHTSAWLPSTFVAAASYDIQIENTTRHFDAHGVEFRLPHEQAVGVAAVAQQ